MRPGGTLSLSLSLSPSLRFHIFLSFLQLAVVGDDRVVKRELAGVRGAIIARTSALDLLLLFLFDVYQYK